MRDGEPVTTYRPGSPASAAVSQIWQFLVGHLGLLEPAHG
jgi:hypothetical protein